jgi:hypothetical protein
MINSNKLQCVPKMGRKNTWTFNAGRQGSLALGRK